MTRCVYSVGTRSHLVLLELHLRGPLQSVVAQRAWSPKCATGDEMYEFFEIARGKKMFGYDRSGVGIGGLEERIGCVCEREESVAVLVLRAG